MSVAPEIMASTTTEPAIGKPKERFRWWVFILGGALIPVNSLWIARTEALDYSGFPTCASLFFNVIFSLIVLMCINMAVRRVFPKAALCRQELLVVYGMIATGSSLVGHDCMQMVVPTIPHAAYFSTPENRWGEMIVPRLPRWLTISEMSDSVTDFEQGHSTLYNWEAFRIWITPIAAWSVFLIAVITAMLSMVILLRRHWVDNERLTYPIAQIPILITEGGGSNSLFRSRLFWAGFGIAAGIDLLNGLSGFFPNLPHINVKMNDISPWLAASSPWKAMGWTVASFYPFVIGLSFFMPTNMSFSSWFFFFARKAQQVAAAAFGYTGTDAWYPYLKEQSFGGLIAIFAASLWFGRGYVKEIWRSANTGEGRTHDGGISYRSAFVMLGLASVVMMAFLNLAGLALWLAVVYVLLYLMFCCAFTRVRAELGPPSHELGSIGPSNVLVLGLGTAFLGPQNLTIFSLLYFQNRMHRGLLMPQQAECLKAAGESGLRIRTMVGALAAAGVIGVFSAFWAIMHLAYGRHYAAAYHPGAPGSGFSQAALNQLMNWINNPVGSNWLSIMGVVIGAVVALGLAKLAVMYYGFPFHPAGYALGMSFGVDYIWLPIMISWLAKVLILKYAGLRGYRAAIPFFVGLVVGEFVIGGAWSFVRGVLGVQTYTFFL